MEYSNNSNYYTANENEPNGPNRSNEQNRKRQRKDPEQEQFKNVLALYLAKYNLNRKIKTAEQEKVRLENIVKSFPPEYIERQQSKIKTLGDQLDGVIHSATAEKEYYNKKILNIGITLTENVVSRASQGKANSEFSLLGLKFIKNAVNGLKKIMKSRWSEWQVNQGLPRMRLEDPLFQRWEE